jgi:LuxR family transcriptional regulator, maltose regulon positive regulatory protein
MANELPVLGTRSTVARLPAVLVRRPRLDARLADRCRRPVTLVCAPPGSGKTTLVTAWLTSRRRRDVVALTVDGRDNARGQLARIVVAALVECGALSPGSVAGAAGWSALLDAAFAELRVGGQRRILVLDDVQELRSRDALATLAYLVERAPPELQLVMCSRADPPVRLTRMRLAERLGEIRYDDLAFDMIETRALLDAHGLRLTRAQVLALWRRTQGWVAGLRLAAYALQGEADPAEFVDGAAGTESHIADYLLRELFSRQDEPLQRFMLRTSVAARLTPELAHELTDDPAAEARLAELTRNGVFLAELPELQEHVWYRYHAMVSVLLEARLRQQHRELADELHRRAAAWFAANGMPVDAEDHARAARHWPMVGDLAVGRWTDGVLAGAEPDGDWLAGVPSHAIATSGSLSLLAAAEACRQGDRAAADSFRARARRLAREAGSAPATPTPAAPTGPAPLAPPLVDIAYARAFGADAAGRGALTQLHAWSEGGDGSTADQLAELRGIELDLDDGRVGRARQRAATLARRAESTWTGVEARGVLALAAAVDGEVEDAERHALPVLAEGSVGDGPGIGVPRTEAARSVAALALALCHAARGEHRSALDQAAVELPAGADRWLRAVARAVHAALRTPGGAFVGLAAGDTAHPLVTRALVALGTLEAVDPQGRVRVLGGPLEAAVLLARQRWHSGDPAGVLAAVGDPRDARHRPATPCHPRTLIERDCLVALGAAATGAGETAIDAVRRALVAAERTRIYAPLRDRAPSLSSVLAAHVEDLNGHEPLVAELIDRARVSSAPAFVEPLTERERAVLRQLPTLRSNQEIAATMHVSVNTVKTHLKSLYRKLGVASRREAVRRGRALELV